MDNSCSNIIGTTGFMAVFAVSGSVVFLAMQAHNRLLSNFMKKMEFEINKPTTGHGPTKKVRFAGHEMAGQKSHGDGKEYIPQPPAKYSITRNNYRGRVKDDSLEGMPKNWQAMYKGILQYRNLRGYN